jgi:hypothetical protein
VGGSVARLTLAEARVAFREVMAVNPATAYSNAHVAVVLEGGRVLIRNGLDFYEGLFVNNGSRFIMSAKPVNALLDEAALARLANREQLTAAEAARVTSALNANGTTLSNAIIYENRIAASFTQVNRAIEQLGPQRFQQLTERYVELVRSNKDWTWARDVDSTVSRTEINAIRQAAIDDGLLPNVPYYRGTNFPDFNAVPGLVREVRSLPGHLWRLSDDVQFRYLDNLIGGRPIGYTWHHSHISGRMELVPTGIHQMYFHEGGRAPGMWAYRPQGRK